jgi:hypothetical protein
MRLAAREYAQTYFGPQVITDQYEAVYQAALEHKKVAVDCS